MWLLIYKYLPIIVSFPAKVCLLLMIKSAYCLNTSLLSMTMPVCCFWQSKSVVFDTVNDNASLLFWQCQSVVIDNDCLLWQNMSTVMSIPVCNYWQWLSVDNENDRLLLLPMVVCCYCQWLFVVNGNVCLVLFGNVFC